MEETSLNKVFEKMTFMHLLP